MIYDKQAMPIASMTRFLTSPWFYAITLASASGELLGMLTEHDWITLSSGLGMVGLTAILFYQRARQLKRTEDLADEAAHRESIRLKLEAAQHDRDRIQAQLDQLMLQVADATCPYRVKAMPPPAGHELRPANDRSWLQPSHGCEHGDDEKSGHS